MSARCPYCKAEIHSDEFGLISCPSCGAQVMLGIDESAEAEPSPDEPPPIVTPPAPADPALPANAELIENLPAVENEPAHDGAVVKNAKPESEPAENASFDLSDIADYGNSALSQARDGTLRFHLYLTNIDTADTRKSVREILADSRFLFDVDQIMNSIRDGTVKISDVTPVKAAILVQRLRPLSVGISWEQYAIHAV